MSLKLNNEGRRPELQVQQCGLAVWTGKKRITNNINKKEEERKKEKQSELLSWFCETIEPDAVPPLRTLLC